MALLPKALAIGATIAGAFCVAPSSAPAQQGETLAEFLIAGMPQEHRSDARTLAICVLAEAGRSRIDHAGILFVLRRRAEQLSRRSGQLISQPEMARRYCRIFRDPPKHRAFLRSFAWSQPAPRPQYQDAWTAAQLSVVLHMLSVDYDPCDGLAMHWGSHADSEKGRPRHTVSVFCGPTRNLFWSGPRRSSSI